MDAGKRVVAGDMEWNRQRHDDESCTPGIRCGLHAGDDPGDLRPVRGVVDPPVIHDRRGGESSLLEQPFDDLQAAFTVSTRRRPERADGGSPPARVERSEEHTSELQSHSFISYAV